MSKIKLPEVLTELVDILTPLDKDQRNKVISAALMLLSDSPSESQKLGSGSQIIDSEVTGIHPKGAAWMKKYAVTSQEIEQVFHLEEGKAEIIVSGELGKTKKEKTLNAYILQGISQILVKGEPNFSDEEARELCNRLGFYDSGNHTAYLRARENNFTGTAEKGWSVTVPGLGHGAQLIKSISKKDA